MLDERVVFLGCSLCKGLEPVCIVCDAIFLCPLHHAGSHGVSYRAVQTGTVLYDVNHLVINTFGQVLVHLLAIENLLAEVLAGFLTRCNNAERLLLESLAHNLKSQFVCHNCA